MGGIFKAYDIRGIYRDSIDEDIVFKIGRAFATFLKCKKVVVGRDMRPHSKPLFDALARGLTMQGADVIDLGLCSTPMSYFANGILGGDAGIMITASHNPAEWNGLKLSRREAIPISGDTGILDIERIVRKEAYDPAPPSPGKVVSVDIAPRYIEHVRRFAALKRPIKIAADMANAMGIYEAKALHGLLEIDAIYNDLDGTFPNHEANPLKSETLQDLQKKIKKGQYDFGVAFDGDADRSGFLDEKGNIVPMDAITCLVAQDILSREKGAILYDLRSSWAVKEVIIENGGTPVMSRVGHAFIKKQMRDVNGLFAGELSGHYYFRDNYFTESSAMAVLCVANIVSRADRPLSALVRPLRRYVASGELNFRVPDPSAMIEMLRNKYTGGRVLTLDGVTVEFDDWWFNVRASNTEPLIRLNIEARTTELMERKKKELTDAIAAGNN